MQRDQGATDAILHAPRTHGGMARAITKRRALLLPILGDADAALKGRACYALGYRHENAGRDKEGEEWLRKAALYGLRRPPTSC